ncbi:MAG: 16S rRNA (uracil(1498)-N(3))-methyltransferase [Rhizobiaceae bacterium]|nr:16S rRNA (uracil(1498)-N(3))-methyltransferase [Rhizobiaceae bacterium]
MSERYDFRTQRLFVAQSLVANVAIEPDHAQSNYLLNVLRLKDGSDVLLFNGRDGEWLGSLKPIGPKSCEIMPISQLREQPEPYDQVYLFAPLKQSRLDYMVQKAVEMGVGVLQPVLTRHTQFTKSNSERIESYAKEAAAQCGILTIPKVKPSEKLLGLLDKWDNSRHIIYCDETESDDSAVEILQQIKPGPLAILIGPEGGFSSEERKHLKSLDFITPISLGPRILCADTAAVAALTLVQAVAGDWRKKE